MKPRGEDTVVYGVNNNVEITINIPQEHGSRRNASVHRTMPVLVALLQKVKINRIF
ncbi:hypothetical protein J6590_030708 [Homalodisca vitripennis]|nr:hypothetical protein J6590_030708 [Homalodisca vitripennis]